MPCLPSLDHVKRGVQNFKATIQRFEFREADIFETEEPTVAEWTKQLTAVKRVLIGRPNETILVFYCFLGHAVVGGGRTMVLTNEFDPITRFYKTICCESDIRAMACRFSNSY